MLAMTEKILQAYKDDTFVSLIIIGEKGLGKTSYQLHIASEIYGWDKALDYLFFNPITAMDLFIDALEKRYKIPYVALDDAGRWLSKTRWWEEHKQDFAEFYDTIRTACNAVSFSEPGDNIISRISSESGTYYAYVYPYTEEMSKAEIYKLIPIVKKKPTLVSKKVATDFYPRHYPNHIKKKYEEMRLAGVLPTAYKTKKSLQEIVSEGEGKGIRQTIEEMVLKMLEDGIPKRKIAAKLGISRKTVYNIIERHGKREFIKPRKLVSNG